MYKKHILSGRTAFGGRGGLDVRQDKVGSEDRGGVGQMPWMVGRQPGVQNKVAFRIKISYCWVCFPPFISYFCFSQWGKEFLDRTRCLQENVWHKKSNGCSKLFPGAQRYLTRFVFVFVIRAFHSSWPVKCKKWFLGQMICPNCSVSGLEERTTFYRLGQSREYLDSTVATEAPDSYESCLLYLTATAECSSH